jgi:hypothetical protein
MAPDERTAGKCSTLRFGVGEIETHLAVRVKSQADTPLVLAAVFI